MQPPAIQVALNNLVETVRTAVTAELLEFLRGDAKPARPKRVAKAKKRPTKKAAGKQAPQRAKSKRAP